ncbi:MAG: hypothetical protein WCS34_06520 [Bacteroidales bacterium]
MKAILFVTNSVMGVVLSRFAISKLAGWDISVKAFIEMAKPLGIDPTFFRIATGIVISAVVISYFLTAIFSLLKHNNLFTDKIPFKMWASFANLFGLLTMVGALLSEFLLRVQPKMLLVYISSGIVLLSAVNILILNSKKYIVR